MPTIRPAITSAPRTQYLARAEDFTPISGHARVSPMARPRCKLFFHGGHGRLATDPGSACGAGRAVRFVCLRCDTAARTTTFLGFGGSIAKEKRHTDGATCFPTNSARVATRTKHRFLHPFGVPNPLRGGPRVTRRPSASAPPVATFRHPVGVKAVTPRNLGNSKSAVRVGLRPPLHAWLHSVTPLG